MWDLVSKGMDSSRCGSLGASEQSNITESQLWKKSTIKPKEHGKERKGHGMISKGPLGEVLLT